MPDSPPEAIAETATLPAVTETPDVNVAESSPAKPEGAETLIDAVQSALKGDQQESSPDSDRDLSPSADPKTEQADEGPIDLDTIGEDLGRYSHKTKRRIQALLDDRREKNLEIERLRPKAQELDKITQFAESARLSQEDLGVIYEIGALIRNDPFKARERLMPIMRQLDELTGNVLPDELQERARLGYVSEEDARRLAQTEARAQYLARAAEEERAAREQQSERAAAESHVRSVSTVASDWEKAKRTTDPDWSVKQARIGELVELEVLKNGFPKTQKAVVDMLDGFHKRVSEEIGRIAPRRPIQPVTGTASTRAAAEPRSALEAAKLALGAVS